MKEEFIIVKGIKIKMSEENLKNKGIWINPLNTHTFREKQAEFNWCVYDKRDIAKSINLFKERIKDKEMIKAIDEVFGDFEA